MQKKWPKACPCVLWRFDWHRPDALRFILPTPSNFTTHLFGAAPVIIPQIQPFLDLIYTDFLNVSYWVSSWAHEGEPNLKIALFVHWWFCPPISQFKVWIWMQDNQCMDKICVIDNNIKACFHILPTLLTSHIWLHLALRHARLYDQRIKQNGLQV